MKAIIIEGSNRVDCKDIPPPESVANEHMIIKMQTFGINAGDNAFIAGMFPPGFIPVSRYDVAGVSGVGTVIETGPGVPAEYRGKNVTVYRSLKFSNDIIGTWSELAHLHYLQCAILPDTVNIDAYSGSLVNIITPYALLKQAEQEGHQGIICTAGNSATGIAMLGICQVYGIPVISIIREEKDKKELEKLGGVNILIQSEVDFKAKLKEISQELKTTAVFDGVGGSTLSNIMDALPFNSTVYSYGYLGGQTPLSFHTSLLMRGITLKGFGNFRTPTVQDPEKLDQALRDISRMIHQPHFVTKVGQRYPFEKVADALKFSSPEGGKAVLYIK